MSREGGIVIYNITYNVKVIQQPGPWSLNVQERPVTSAGAKCIGSPRTFLGPPMYNSSLTSAHAEAPLCGLKLEPAHATAICMYSEPMAWQTSIDLTFKSHLHFPWTSSNYYICMLSGLTNSPCCKLIITIIIILIRILHINSSSCKNAIKAMHAWSSGADIS